MISVIYPTMWKARGSYSRLKEIAAIKSVSEIIVIDNTEAKVTLNEKLNKVIHIQEGRNTYVNPAWNKGVQMAKEDKILIVNDDVETDWSIIDKMDGEGIITSGKGMIGAGVSCWQGPHTESGIAPINHRPNCYGSLFFIHKESYVPIPDDLKIHYGDDWLFTKSGKPNFEIIGWKMGGDSEQTSGLAQFHPIKESDKHLWNSKYQSMHY